MTTPDDAALRVLLDRATKGPWNVYPNAAECPGIEGDGVSIIVFGEALTDEEECGVQGYTVDESRANAALIALTPTLATEVLTLRAQSQADAAQIATLTAEVERLTKSKPLTASDLADALGCFWNAALGQAQNQQEGHAFASIMAEGIAAVENRLKEHTLLPKGPTDAT